MSFVGFGMLSLECPLSEFKSDGTQNLDLILKSSLVLATCLAVPQWQEWGIYQRLYLYSRLNNPHKIANSRLSS